MAASTPHSWLRTAALVGAGYAIVGIITVALARTAPSPGIRTMVRFAAWGISALLFGTHISLEHRSRLPPRRAAGHTAVAVVLATLVLALIAVVRQLQGSHVRASILLAIAVWPILTGVVSFVVAAVVLVVWRALTAGKRSQPRVRTDEERLR